MPRILALTPKQPSANPHMRKAYEALAREEFKVHVLFADGVCWAAQHDEEIFQNSPCTWQKVRGDSTNRLPVTSCVLGATNLTEWNLESLCKKETSQFQPNKQPE